MTARREPPKVGFSISCLESEWERIREIAEAREVSINDHVISAGLTVELDPAAQDAPALALSGAEQRRLVERVDRLADSMLADAGQGTGSIALLRQSIELVLAETLRDMVRQGRDRELGPLLAETFGPDYGPEVERQFRAWMERNPPSG